MFVPLWPLTPVWMDSHDSVIFGIYAISTVYMGWTLSPPDEKLWVVLLNSYQDTIPGHPHYKGYHGDDGADLDLVAVEK